MTDHASRGAAGWPSRSTSMTSSSPPGSRVSWRRGSASRRSVSSCSARRGRRRSARSPISASMCFSTSSCTTSHHRRPRPLGCSARSACVYLTLHATGGEVMLRAGVDGLAEGAAGAGLQAPLALAVTILTSDDGAPPHILPKRVAAAIEAGCGGIVCAAADVREAKQYGPRLFAVVPGIRPAGADPARSGPRRDPGHGPRGGRRPAGGRPGGHRRPRPGRGRRPPGGLHCPVVLTRLLEEKPRRIRAGVGTAS